MTYTKPICREYFAFGNACRRCERRQAEAQMVEVIRAYDALVKAVLERCIKSFSFDEYTRIFIVDGMVHIACPTLEYGYYNDATLEPAKGSVPVKDLLEPLP